MSIMLDENKLVVADLEEMSAEALLTLVGDKDRGCKSFALDRLMAMGLEQNFPIYERAIRDDEHADIRNGAMEVMTRFGRKALPKLLALLTDENEEIRNFSTVMLGEIGSREAIGPLIQTLRDTDANVRHGAAEALGKIGDRSALLPLLELLKEDFWLQYPAIAAIASMKDSRAVPHLLKMLGNEMLNEAIIDALGEIGDPRALVSLGDILGRYDIGISGKIVQAIIKIYHNIEDDCRYRNSMLISNHSASTDNIINRDGVEKIRLLLKYENNVHVVKSAIILLGWLGEESALPEIFNVLDNDDEYLEQVENAVLAMGKETIPVLVDSLYHSSENVRIVSVRSLRWLGGADEQEKVAMLLFDNSNHIQLEVLESIRGAAIHSIISRLIELLKTGNEEIGCRSAEVLGFYPYSDLQHTIEEMASSTSSPMRKRAALLMGSLCQPAATGAIATLLKDPDPAVKREAIKSVGKLKAAEFLSTLHEALDDEDPGVQEEAVSALTEFGDKESFLKPLSLLGSGSENLDYAIIRGIAKVGRKEAGETLVKYLLKDMNGRSLEYALIEALGKIGYSPAIPLITDRYLKHDDPDIRRCAVQALGEIADTDPRIPIEEACRDSHWSVRIAALDACVGIFGKKSLPALLEALNDADLMVRKNAVRVLGDMRDVSTITRLAGLLIDVEIGKYAFEALLKFGRSALPWLHRIIKGDYLLEVRERVIDLVGKIGDRKSVETLMCLLDDSHASIRLAAIDALVFCFDSVPLKKLTYVIKHDAHDEVREKAILAQQIMTMEKFFP